MPTAVVSVEYVGAMHSQGSASGHTVGSAKGHSGHSSHSSGGVFTGKVCALEVEKTCYYCLPHITPALAQGITVSVLCAGQSMRLYSSPVQPTLRSPPVTVLVPKHDSVQYPAPVA